MEWVVGLICLGLIVGLVGYALVTYNGMVRARTACRAAFASIDVQLTRRHELIPNIVEVARGYLKHERETLEAVIDARMMAVGAQATVAGGIDDTTALAMLASAENMLTAALGRIFGLVESYPDLKASVNMLQVQEELTTTENRIAFARQAYNDAVMIYNTKRDSFPANLLAGIFSFDQAQLFHLNDPQQRQAPPVAF